MNQDAQAKPCVENISFGNIKEKVNKSNLPDTSPSDKEEEHTNKLKVLNNYRNFGNMYFLKNNHKKAEWAYKNGIKQAASSEIKSKEQLRSVLMAEVEFRFSRAKYEHTSIILINFVFNFSISGVFLRWGVSGRQEMNVT